MIFSLQEIKEIKKIETTNGDLLCLRVDLKDSDIDISVPISEGNTEYKQIKAWEEDGLVTIKEAE